VLAGCCRYESLLSGEVNISHVAMMNDALAVQYENQRRASKRSK
jgi:hypothetical protein